VQMAQSEHPLSKLMFARIAASLFLNDKGKESLDANGFNSAQVIALTTPPSVSALNAAIQTVIPPEPSPRSIWSGDTLLHLNWAIVFALVGAAWGRMRWGLRARTHGLRGVHLVKFINRRSQTGKVVLSLLSLDLVSHAMLSIPPEGVRVPFANNTLKFPEKMIGLPSTTVVSITEAAVLTVAGLFAVRYQRFVVLPVVLASTVAHWGAISEFTKPYQDILGIKLDKIAFPVGTTTTSSK